MRKRSERICVLPALVMCMAAPVYLEVITHLFVYRGFTFRIIFPVLFAMTLGCLLFAIGSFLPKKAGKIVLPILTGLISLYFVVQFTYRSIFGEFMSLWQVTFGATAITNFWKATLYGIFRVLPQILVLLLPVPVMAVLLGRETIRFRRLKVLWLPVLIAAFFALHFTTVGLMILRDTDPASAYRLYSDPNTSTDVSIKSVGLLATMRLEAKHILFGSSAEDELADYAPIGDVVQIEDSEKDRYNVLDIDFDSLLASTQDEKLKQIDEFLSTQEPTEKNEYTGLLKDYNLIVLCCESYSPHLIDRELTPALFELSTNGFIFQNFYNSFSSNTTNGEYTLCMGLLPDLSRQKSVASFYSSQENYVPFCLGNMFTANGGKAWAYHNYSGNYYSRSATHANMGYTFKSADDGLDMELSWPSSDLEMMEKSVGDYINSGEQFCAYYMTFSGHYQYNWDNSMSVKNRSAVEDLPYSDPVKAYISCNLELEYALEYLMDKLEEAGIADKTAIVLTGDHYPYGLSEEEYDELAGAHVDPTFEKFRNSFLCYVPGMRVNVPTYCSTVDILPTLLNLFGFAYDSRLLAGRDVLSPQAENMAILIDHSFITPQFSYDASNGAVRTTIGTPPDAQTIEEKRTILNNKLKLSADILNTDFYSHALLGASESGSTFEQYQFEDIPKTFIIRALDYVIDNGYMEPVSDTTFGFQDECSTKEFLTILYRMAEEPAVAPEEEDAAVLAWAQKINILTPEQAEQMDILAPVTRKLSALGVYRLAEYQGFAPKVTMEYTDDVAASGVSLTPEEQESLAWCFEISLMRAQGTMLSNLQAADDIMKRYYIINVVYNYYLHYLQG